MVRGDNVVVCGLVDEELDGSIDWTKVKGREIGGRNMFDEGMDGRGGLDGGLVWWDERTEKDAERTRWSCKGDCKPSMIATQSRTRRQSQTKHQ